MKYYDMPKKQGLYDPQFEHDNCGIGFIANIKGEKSHSIITSAIEIIKNLKHRGGVGSEPDTGDGAGILLQIPDAFMRKVCANEDITLPESGDYGVGMLFCSPDDDLRADSIKKLKEIIEDEGMNFLGIREVPTYAECIGKTAAEARPHILQIFIERPENTEKGIAFERKLFTVLKRAEREIRYSGENADKYFYFTSLSSRTIVYKGMLTPEQVSAFYLDLLDLDVKSAIAMVHSRFSTNTFPSWERAHPNRYIVHNGEINTIRGNLNHTKSRENTFKSDIFGSDINKIRPVINEDGSDSAMLDNYINMLSLSGFSLPEAIMMTIPEPWENDTNMEENRRAFYEYNSCSNEPWDGPAAIAFSDGEVVGATLDRNGLRPARFYVTDDGLVVLSSEVGVFKIDESRIIKKDRLRPGKMLLIDTKEGRIIEDDEIKNRISALHPYKKWVEENLTEIADIQQKGSKVFTWAELTEEVRKKTRSLRKIANMVEMFDNKSIKENDLPILTMQKIFGYTWEDIDMTIRNIAENGEDPIRAMGNDAPLAVLSDKPQLLYNYFKQLFAQVTNPPIDVIREKIVTSTITYLGGESNILERSPENCRKIRLQTPILSISDINKLKSNSAKGFKSIVLPMLYDVKEEDGLNKSLETLFSACDTAIENGCSIIILSDKGVNENMAAIPALLAGAGLHRHLIENGTRMKASIILETGEPREVHHFAVLIGFGINAVCPYLVYSTIADMCRKKLVLKDEETAEANYIYAVTSGILKIASKMGISTIQSYFGAQIFEALGISEHVVNKFFTGTATRIGGIDIPEIDKETKMRHTKAFDPVTKDQALDAGGDYKWKRGGEYHIYNPKTIYKLQTACRTGDYKLYKEFADAVTKEAESLSTVRSMLDIRTNDKPIHISEVEPVESIVKRFKTGAMSYGSISLEAHECMAIAMNRLGGKSNSGEGGENPDRYIKDENGDSRCSAIKQVASGRFGVTINYLQNAVEIQIKMAQGAKPGEGGHLPGKKVYPWIAKARNSTTGVGLISPPPHHDIYSIEDLAQLIHDLKNANRDARISVKLVSEAGVGTIAVGVAKSRADVILVSGYDGGTGAAPGTSIRHAGLPWELGVAEVHQALLMNNLRNRVALEADGKLLTGRDVAVAALLGAEEFGFATGPLVVMGCVMMRVCNLDTCPVGVATQNPHLRKKFAGKPEYVENFMRFIAQDLREWMAKIGVRTVNEMIGHVEKLKPKKVTNMKARTVDLGGLLYQPKICSNDSERYANVKQDHELEKSLDMNALVRLCEPAISEDKKIVSTLEIKNTNRAVGTILSSEITRRRGADGLPDDTVDLTFVGSAGQSFGAFLTYGVTMRLVGDCNDYMGKGLSGGKIIVIPPKESAFKADENIITGNVALFGAISGEAYIKGRAGERFCVRNSGISAVVEGIGEHGCEYMTGGRVVVLGSAGRNFGAGMSGGIAYVYDVNRDFAEKCNSGVFPLKKVENEEDISELKALIENHFKFTESEKAKYILDNWDNEVKNFVKVIPQVYEEVVNTIKEAKAQGMGDDDAAMEAFVKVTGVSFAKEGSVVNG